VSRPYISQELRRTVIDRASRLCEYCLIHERDTAFGCAIDHIISLKHGGATNSTNLAYACAFCNRSKGSDIGSIVWNTGKFSRFYHPRRDSWSEHFKLQGATISSLTEIGEVTARILGFNDRGRLLERQILIDRDRYPHPVTSKYLQQQKR